MAELLQGVVKSYGSTKEIDGFFVVLQGPGEEEEDAAVALGYRPMSVYTLAGSKLVIGLTPLYEPEFVSVDEAQAALELIGEVLELRYQAHPTSSAS